VVVGVTGSVRWQLEKGIKMYIFLRGEWQGGSSVTTRPAVAVAAMGRHVCMRGGGGNGNVAANTVLHRFKDEKEKTKKKNPIFSTLKEW